MRRGVTSTASAASNPASNSAMATWLFRAGGVALAAATVGLAASAADDLVLYRVHEQYVRSHTTAVPGVLLGVRSPRGYCWGWPQQARHCSHHPQRQHYHTEARARTIAALPAQTTPPNHPRAPNPRPRLRCLTATQLRPSACTKLPETPARNGSGLNHHSCCKPPTPVPLADASSPSPSSARRMAMDKLREHPHIKEVLGEPLTPRAWWNASVKKAPDGASVGVYFVVDGPKGSSDVYVRVRRLYHIITCSGHPTPPPAHAAASVCCSRTFEGGGAASAAAPGEICTTELRALVGRPSTLYSCTHYAGTSHQRVVALASTSARPRSWAASPPNAQAETRPGTVGRFDSNRRCGLGPAAAATRWCIICWRERGGSLCSSTPCCRTSWRARGCPCGWTCCRRTPLAPTPASPGTQRPPHRRAPPRHRRRRSRTSGADWLEPARGVCWLRAYVWRVCGA